MLLHLLHLHSHKRQANHSLNLTIHSQFRCHNLRNLQVHKQVISHSQFHKSQLGTSHRLLNLTNLINQVNQHSVSKIEQFLPHLQMLKDQFHSCHQETDQFRPLDLGLLLHRQEEVQLLLHHHIGILVPHLVNKVCKQVLYNIVQGEDQCRHLLQGVRVLFLLLHSLITLVVYQRLNLNSQHLFINNHNNHNSMRSRFLNSKHTNHHHHHRYLQINKRISSSSLRLHLQ